MNRVVLCLRVTRYLAKVVLIKGLSAGRHSHSSLALKDIVGHYLQSDSHLCHIGHNSSKETKAPSTCLLVKALRINNTQKKYD